MASVMLVSIVSILQLQALHSENQGNGEEIRQASCQQMAQGLVVFPLLLPDFLLLSFLPSVPFHPFVEVDIGRINPFSQIPKFGSREHQHLQCGKKACAIGGEHLVFLALDICSYAITVSYVQGF